MWIYRVLGLFSLIGIAWIAFRKHLGIRAGLLIVFLLLIMPLCGNFVYVLNFTLFGQTPTPRNLIIEILPVIGMTALNIGYRLKDASGVRRCGLVASPSWLIYNIASGSWGAIACEVMTLVSIVIGMLRHDKTRRNRPVA